MNFRKNVIRFSGAILLALALAACGSDRTPETLEDETPNKMTFDEQNDRPKMAPQQDNAKVVRNWDAYTYIIEVEDSAFPVVAAKEKETEAKAMKVSRKKGDNEYAAENKPKNQSGAYSEKSKAQDISNGITVDVPKKVGRDEIEPFDIAEYMGDLEVEVDMKAVIKNLDLNRPPLFDRSCLAAEYPGKCSTQKIQEYIAENLEMPDPAFVNGNYEGVEIVSFRINAEGEIEPGEIEVLTNTICDGCAQAAAKLVSQMPNNWVPARQNGKTSGTRINLPIRFNYKGTTSLK